MNNSKLLDLLKKGNIVVPLYFLQNYKKLKLELEEFIFLMYLYNLGDKCLFDPNKFSKDLNISNKNVMTYVGKLSDKGLISVKTLKTDKGLMEEYITLDDFYNKMSPASGGRHFVGANQCSATQTSALALDTQVIFSTA